MYHWTSVGNSGHVWEALRDHLVCGLRSESTQKRLLSEADLMLTQAVKIAQSMEAAHKNAQALKGLELPVRRLEKLTRDRSDVERKARGQGGRKPCYHCGQRGHLPHECGFREATCHKCKKKGHIVLCKVCRSAQTQLSRAVPSGWKHRHPNRKTMMRLL